MKLFSGLGKTDYQDVLRALGLFLDERGYRNIRLVEHEDGIIIQATPSTDGQAHHVYETFLLTEDDLLQIMHWAYGRRTNTEPLSPPRVLPTGHPLSRGQRPPPPL